MVDRRGFILGSAMVGAFVVAPGVKASGDRTVPEEKKAEKLIVSAPVLMNAAETSVAVIFAVSDTASGWVEYATTPDFSDVRRTYSGGAGLMDVRDGFAVVRLRGLKPATRHYYRIGADRIRYRGGYAMKCLGTEAEGRTRSFVTLGAAATGSFCVINDTHERQEALKLVFSKLSALGPAVTVWNGDASNTTENLAHAMRIFVTPHPEFPEYASETPILFSRGNHDFRGRFNRELFTLIPPREPTERAGAYAELGRNFVQRLGDVALIGLDTGEDKLDTNPVQAGIFRMQAYRELQAQWLAEAVESEAVKTARFVVACCHIPLFDGDPKSNPGDVAPADAAPGYDYNFANWQRTCARLWEPSFRKAGVQLVIAGHTHAFRCDQPSGDRAWTQIVGGGPELGEDGTPPRRYPTVIEGHVEDGKLVVRVHNVLTDVIVGTYAFDPRCV